MANPHSTRLKAETSPPRAHHARWAISAARRTRSPALFARNPLKLDRASHPAGVAPSGSKSCSKSRKHSAASIPCRPRALHITPKGLRRLFVLSKPAGLLSVCR